MADPRSTSDTSGRVLGMVVFGVGILLLLFVFYIVYTELVSGALSRLTAPNPQQGPDLNLALAILLRGLFLFLLGYLASAIAGRGIGMYHAARLPEGVE